MPAWKQASLFADPREETLLDTQCLLATAVITVFDVSVGKPTGVQRQTLGPVCRVSQQAEAWTAAQWRACWPQTTAGQGLWLEGCTHLDSMGSGVEKRALGRLLC